MYLNLSQNLLIEDLVKGKDEEKPKALKKKLTKLPTRVGLR